MVTPSERPMTFAGGGEGRSMSSGSMPLPRIVMNGDRPDIQASVDLAGLKMLKEMLTKFEGILEMMAPGHKAASPMPWENKEKPAQVPLMITLAQKERLRDMGYSDEQIVNMTPEQAHKLPGIFG
jgi:hypothetical protein